MQRTIRLGVVAVASPLEVGADQAPDLLSQLAKVLASGERLDVIPAPRTVDTGDAAVSTGRYFYDERVDAICVIGACWFEDHFVLDLLEECGVPLIIWARPGMETGSLCGMQQLAFMLGQLAHPFCFLFEALDSKVAVHRVVQFAAAASLRQALRRARIGYLGHRVEGMTETTANEIALKKSLGPRVVGLDSKLFLDRVDQVRQDIVADQWCALVGQVGQVTSSDEDGLYSLRVWAALQQLIVEQGLSAIAVGCYPHLMGKVCLAASLLGEQGVPVACEGDVNGAVGMLMLTLLTGEPVHNTDLLDPIPDENAIVFSHCGSGGFSLASRPDDITLGPVRLMDCGVCCLFPARPGPVTLLNVMPGVDGYRLGVLSGQAVSTEMVFPGNPLRVRFQTDYRQILDWIVKEGLGHHWMAAYGDLTQALADLAEITGCSCTFMA